MSINKERVIRMTNEQEIKQLQKEIDENKKRFDAVMNENKADTSDFPILKRTFTYRKGVSFSQIRYAINN